MKFGKELASQMVQEWREAYMDYNELKKLLKDVLRFRQQNAPPPLPASEAGSLRRRLSMYRTFSGLTNRYNNLRAGSPRKTEDEVILVGSVQQAGGSEDVYQTMFLKSSEVGGEFELIYFDKLDREFNKVLKFYKEKVEEVKGKAEELSKQMDALIALRFKVDRPGSEERIGSGTAMGPNSGGSEPATLVASVNLSKPGRQLGVIHEVEMSSEGTTGEEEQIRAEKRKKYDHQFRPPVLDVLGQVTVNIDPATPISTLRNVVMSSHSELSFSKEELRKAEEKLRVAFVEFYQQLRLLKSYCFLNILAFSKIMKKYDKITSRSASKAYVEMVDKSYLGSSDEVNKLIERVESTFIKHFSNGNHRKGMKCLRPKHKRERHRTTFFLGLFTGCSIALIAAIIVTVHLRNLFIDRLERERYMDSIFFLYSLFGYIVLHMIMYGANTYFWKRSSVNYPFIMGLKPGTELGFREVFLVASGLSVLALAGALANLDLEMDRATQNYKTLTELVPLALILFVVLITFCPFNIIYRSSRFFLIQCLWRCLCAPLYKVTLSDFFFADQLTSQVQAIRCIQFYVAYYVWGDFTKRSTTFLNSDTYKTFYIAVAIVPFASRVLQCLRRLVEEKDVSQAFNAFKYFSTIVALVMKTMLELRGGSYWTIMVASTSGFTTVYNTYWDVVIDWGLLQRNSKNPWLRDKLLVSNKAVYFVAIIVNILLRLVWMQLVFGIQSAPFLHRRAMTALVACLEILRRGIWNFFRLENEHLNNVGKYRAFNSVPLPFHYGNGNHI